MEWLVPLLLIAAGAALIAFGGAALLAFGVLHVTGWFRSRPEPAGGEPTEEGPCSAR